MSTALQEQFARGLEGVIAGTTTICTINPENESLLYRGYPAPELAEEVVFEEVIHLLLEGRLPKKRELRRVQKLLYQKRKVDKKLIKVLKQIPPTANPMDVLRTSTSFIGTQAENRFYNIEESKEIAYELIAELPFALMTWFNTCLGRPIPKVSRDNTHAGRILHLITGAPPNEFEEKVINASLILYAEHELNASTFCSRIVTSTKSDIYSAMCGAIGTLKGPLHGGATERAIELILKFLNPDDAEKGILDMLSRKEKIMGFGHRVYKKGDSRSYVMKRYSKELAAQRDKMKFYEIAERIEKVVREQKGLFPNADFYSSLAYYILNIPIPLYTPLFVMSRLSGWSAHILEQMNDNRLIRPRAIYQGPPQRDLTDRR